MKRRKHQRRRSMWCTRITLYYASGNLEGRNVTRTQTPDGAYIRYTSPCHTGTNHMHVQDTASHTRTREVTNRVRRNIYNL